MAKSKKNAELGEKHEETYDKIKRAAEFKSLDNPDVKREIQKIVADHAGEELPESDAD